MNNLIKLIILTSVCLLASCQDNKTQPTEEEMKNAQFMGRIESVKEKYEKVLALPKVNKSATTRAGALPKVVPVWEEAYNVEHMNQHIVVVPMKPEEEIKARLRLLFNGELTTHHTQAISKLILRQFGEFMRADVITYLPEEEYAKNHSQFFDTMYDAYKIRFNGVTLISSLNGNIQRAFLYKNGHLVSKMEPRGNKNDGYVQAIDTTKKQSSKKKVAIEVDLYKQSEEAKYRK
ncbi:MAG: hypothetical protein IJZ86_04245 [Bacteroides sp.]|nr:hypothetical protein [Bacteroides sp.]